jgi:hypothetical protein
MHSINLLIDIIIFFVGLIAKALSKKTRPRTIGNVYIIRGDLTEAVAWSYRGQFGRIVRIVLDKMDAGQMLYVAYEHKRVFFISIDFQDESEFHFKLSIMMAGLQIACTRLNINWLNMRETQSVYLDWTASKIIQSVFKDSEIAVYLIQGEEMPMYID